MSSSMVGGNWLRCREVERDPIKDPLTLQIKGELTGAPFGAISLVSICCFSPNYSLFYFRSNEKVQKSQPESILKGL